MPEPKKHQILIVDSVPNATSLIKSSCHDLYVDFDHYTCASDTASTASSGSWDLLIINTGNNVTKAINICETVRSVKPLSQIIVLSTEQDDAAIAQCLSQGADDFISIPCSLIELRARVSSALRRSKDLQPLVGSIKLNLPAVKSITSDAEVIAADFKIFPLAKKAIIAGQSISLTRTELSLLSYLVANKGKSCCKLELLQNVLGYEDECYMPSLYTHMNRLRRKLKQKKINSPFIETVWRYGYRLAFAQQELTEV